MIWFARDSVKYLDKIVQEVGTDFSLVALAIDEAAAPRLVEGELVQYVLRVVIRHEVGLPAYIAQFCRRGLDFDSKIFSPVVGTVALGTPDDSSPVIIIEGLGL